MQIVSTRRTVASEGSKITKKALLLAAVAAASVTGLGTAVRGSNTFVNTGNPANLLNTAAAWNDITSSVAGPPGQFDFAQWSAASGITAPTIFTLGNTNTSSWFGIIVSDVGGNVTVSNDSGILTLGAQGIDMSAASNGNNNFSFLDTISFSASQSFNVAANRNLTCWVLSPPMAIPSHSLVQVISLQQARFKRDQVAQVGSLKALPARLSSPPPTHTAALILSIRVP